MAANLGFAFNTAENIDNSRGDVLGSHRANFVVVHAETAPSSSGGLILTLRAKIIDGENKDREFTTRLNIINSSEKAQKIARAELAAICQAVGLPGIQNGEELYKRPFSGKVKFIPAEGEYGAKNELSGQYKPYDPSVPSEKAPPAPETIFNPNITTQPAQPVQPVQQPMQPMQPMQQAQPQYQQPVQQQTPIQQQQQPVQQFQQPTQQHTHTFQQQATQVVQPVQQMSPPPMQGAVVDQSQWGMQQPVQQPVQQQMTPPWQQPVQQ